MKYLAMVIFIFMIQVSASMVNYLSLEDSYSVTPHKEFLNSVNKTVVKEESYVQEAQVNEPSVFDSIVDVVKALWYFVKIFGWGIISVPYTLKSFGLDATLAYFVSAPVYMLYFLAIAQWLGDKQMKGME